VEVHGLHELLGHFESRSPAALKKVNQVATVLFAQLFGPGIEGESRVRSLQRRKIRKKRVREVIVAPNIFKTDSSHRSCCSGRHLFYHIAQCYIDRNSKRQVERELV